MSNALAIQEDLESVKTELADSYLPKRKDHEAPFNYDALGRTFTISPVDISAVIASIAGANAVSYQSRIVDFYAYCSPDWANLNLNDYTVKFVGTCRLGPKDLENVFNSLANQWYKETRKLSSAEQIVLHPAYQRIISFGKDALPFIFRELERTRGHWIWALSMITGEDPATKGMNFRQAVDAWLEWGKEHSYIE
jgi:hypothetical protein